MSLRTTLNLTAQASKTFGSLGTLAAAISPQLTIPNGTADGQSDLAYIAETSVTSGSPLSLDLRGGSLVALGGQTFSIVEMQALVVRNAATSGSATITVGGGSNPVIATREAIGPGGYHVSYFPGAGLAVAAGTGDILQISASAGTITVQILVVGRSA